MDISDLLTILIIVVIVIVMAILRYKRIKQIQKLRKKGLKRFLSCAGKEKWGYQDKIVFWRNNEIKYLSVKIKPINNEISKLQYSIERLKDRDITLNNLQAQQIIALNNAKMLHDQNLIDMMQRKVRNTQANIQENSRQMRLRQKEINSLQRTEKRSKECISAYKKGKNPQLLFPKNIIGLFFYLK
jgi:hypothetical protein